VKQSIGLFIDMACPSTNNTANVQSSPESLAVLISVKNTDIKCSEGASMDTTPKARRTSQVMSFQDSNLSMAHDDIFSAMREASEKSETS
jgi:hypothetical protein